VREEKEVGVRRVHVQHGERRRADPVAPLHHGSPRRIEIAWLHRAAGLAAPRVHA
jgi:hypothetical protein